MMKEHLSDEQLQAYAMNEASAPAMVAHIHTCAFCSSKVEEYRLLMSALAAQEAPAFDFDVSELVLSQISVQQRKEKNGWLYLFILLGLIISVVAVYLFRAELSTLFSGMGQFALYLAVVTGALITIAIILDQLKTYKNKLALLD